MEGNINNERDMLNSSIQRLDSDLTDLTSERARFNEEVKELDKLKKEEIVLKNIITDSNKFQMDLDRVSENLSNTKSELNSIRKEILKQKSELDSVLQLKQNAECPYCNQKLDQQHIRALENKFLQRSNYLKNKIIHMEKEIIENQAKKMKF